MSHIALSMPTWSQAQTAAFRMQWFIKFTTPVNQQEATANDGSMIDLEDVSSPLEFWEVNTGDHMVSMATGTIHTTHESEQSDPKSELHSELNLLPFGISDSSAPLLVPSKPLKQLKLAFPRVSKVEQLKMEHQRTLKRKAEDEALGELEQKINEEKLLAQRLKARDKKQHWRENKQARLENEVAKRGSSFDTPLSNSLALSPPTTPDTAATITTSTILSCGVAELSRPHRQSKLLLSGQDYDKVLTAAKHVNWRHPFLWYLINGAAVAVGYPWSPAEIIKRLQTQYPELFVRLCPQRISYWRDGAVKDCLKWKDSVLRAVESGNHPGGTSTRQPLLAKYPDMVSAIKDHLIGLRIAGTPLDTAFVHGFMIATISEHAPELFEHQVSKGKPFQCTSQFVRKFLHKELSWSLRRPTQAAQKVPANAKQVLMQAFLRMACAIHDEDIPSCCIVNSDQTQVVYSAGTQYTWHTQGGKQVPVLGKDEKHAFTLLVGVSNDGQLLPLQAIYQGLSNASLPHPSSLGYAEAIAHVFFVVSMTSTYWLTLETMKAYVILILVPFFHHMIDTNHLPDDQRCIWQIDVWSVHRSEKFWEWLSATYPWIILQYVPGGCTGLFQACDVGLQKIAKAAIHQKSLADIINETTAALRSGANPASFVNNKSIGTLQNHSVSWINEVIKVINKPNLIKKAFELCAVPEMQFNLSYQSLTSHEARQAIQELKTSNPKFHAEITAGRPIELSEEVEPEENNTTTTDELSSSDHIQIVMSSATAGEVIARVDEADLEM
ncbi:hypothetical protein FRC11_010785 [Ceratobasidium sp. 423]|nr:hypothetical protein FRC11_010785 [Ceratobasidium sp. 423]